MRRTDIVVSFEFLSQLDYHIIEIIVISCLIFSPGLCPLWGSGVWGWEKGNQGWGDSNTATVYILWQYYLIANIVHHIYTLHEVGWVVSVDLEFANLKGDECWNTASLQNCLQVYHKQCFSCKRCGRSIDTLAVEVGPGKVPVTRSQNQRPDRPGDLLQGLPEGRVSTWASSGGSPYHTTVDLSDGQTIQLSRATIGFDGCPSSVKQWGG